MLYFSQKKLQKNFRNLLNYNKRSNTPVTRVQEREKRVEAEKALKI